MKGADSKLVLGSSVTFSMAEHIPRVNEHKSSTLPRMEWSVRAKLVKAENP